MIAGLWSTFQHCYAHPTLQQIHRHRCFLFTLRSYNDLLRAGAQVTGSGPGALGAADDFVVTRYGQARDAGLNLVRIFATQGDNGTNLALEPQPGTAPSSS